MPPIESTVRRARPVAALVALLLATATATASATSASVRPVARPDPQALRVDVGSFTLYTNDQRAGREQFSVQRLTGADGVALELRAESAIGDRRAAVRLETDSAAVPVRYSIEEREGATVTLRLGGQRVRGRFTTLARSTSGEAAREYLLAPGARVLEDDGVSQYALLVRHRTLRVGDSLIVPVLTPSANRQGTVRLVLDRADDTVTIAGARRVARQWRVVTANNETRVIWSDADDRLLRLDIPARGFRALRDDIPR